MAECQEDVSIKDGFTQAIICENESFKKKKKDNFVASRATAFSKLLHKQWIWGEDFPLAPMARMRLIPEFGVLLS